MSSWTQAGITLEIDVESLAAIKLIAAGGVSKAARRDSGMVLTIPDRGLDHICRASYSQDKTSSDWKLAGSGKLEYSLEVFEHYLQCQ